MISNLNYIRWRETDLEMPLKTELEHLDESEIEERFGKYVEFGTGGMRGEIGVGTNRINVYTIRRAAQGLAGLLEHGGEKMMRQGVVIAYDSRYYSRHFAKETALVLANHGICVYLFDDLRPTPELSFAVRELGAAAGVVITASHNPAEYNGFKVYGDDGGQLPPDQTERLLAEINRVDNELEIATIDFGVAQSQGLLRLIGRTIDEKYQQQLERIVLQPEVIAAMADRLRIVYTPLHGSGNKPVMDALRRAGFKHVSVVPEQEQPDPRFSTVSSPNPEEREAFKLAIALAEQTDADLILGTDPDADRVGVVSRCQGQQYAILNGNETGALMLDYLLMRKQALGTLPANGVVLKTIVTSDIGRVIAEHYGLETEDTLTGFKFIGEKMRQYERTGEKSFVFGYEESYGYLIGDFVRDKDAVQACLFVSEMASHYKAQGLTLSEALLQLYKKYGFYKEDLRTITLKGTDGRKKMDAIIGYIRANELRSAGGSATREVSDYELGICKRMSDGSVRPTGLPRSNVLRYTLEDGSWFAIRPSGTEPKLKVYYSAADLNEAACERKLEQMVDDVAGLIGQIEQRICADSAT